MDHCSQVRDSAMSNSRERLRTLKTGLWDRPILRMRSIRCASLDGYKRFLRCLLCSHPMLVASEKRSTEIVLLPTLRKILSLQHFQWKGYESSHVKGWILGNHDDRSSSRCDGLLSPRTLRCGNHDRFVRDRTISWVRIVNGINKYVTETSEEILVSSVADRG